MKNRSERENGGGQGSRPNGRRDARLLWGFFLVTLFLGFFLSPFASSFPDGLERVAEKLGFSGRVTAPTLSAPIPDYVFPGVKDERLATGLAGLLGTCVVGGVALILSHLFRRPNKRENGAGCEVQQ